jgi:uncharacterized protein
MSRIIFILVLLAVGYLMLKSWLRKQYLQQKNQQSAGKMTKSTRMLRCEHCGLHVPEHEAISQGGKHFCSLEHAKKHLTSG